MVKIGKLTPEDWEAYRALRLEMLKVEPRAFGSSYEEVARRPEAHWQERLREAQRGEQTWLLFARAEERLVGTVGAFRTEERGVAEIVAVYVSPAWRGLGIGLALMEAMLEQLSRVRGLEKAVLGVNSVQAAAVGLYRRLGFVVVREQAGEMGDGETHVGYWMEKTLNPLA